MYTLIQRGIKNLMHVVVEVSVLDLVIMIKLTIPLN